MKNINDLVAEKVLYWKKVFNEKVDNNFIWVDLEGNDCVRSDGSYKFNPIENYDDAYLIVDKLYEEGFRLYTGYIENHTKVESEIINFDGEVVLSLVGDSLCECICLSGLKFREII